MPKTKSTKKPGRKNLSASNGIIESEELEDNR
jgi:hypothetical protein